MEKQKSHILTALEIEQLKKRELEILHAFTSFCEANKLRYFMFGGSLLGAIRHKGFIPWDDDIDVCMPRDDYNKLSNMAGTEMGPDYFIQTHKTDPEYLLPFIKIRDNKSVFLELSVLNSNINHGIFLDIFPLNSVPESRLKRFFYNLKIYRYNIPINKKFNLHEKESILKRFFKFLIAMPYNHLSIPELTKKREEFVIRHQYAKSKYLACGLFSFKLVFNKTDFSSGIEWSFENMNVLVPVNWDNVLKTHYGNYMELPPVEKRITNHPVADFKIW